MTDHGLRRTPLPRAGWPGRGTRRVACAALLALGCDGAQSALSPAGPAAERIDELWWLMFWLSTAIVIVVFAVLGYAITRRRASEDPPPDERWGERWIVLGGIVIPTIVLVGLFVFTMRTLGAIDPRHVDAELYIEVRGERWWWHVVYLGDDPADTTGAFASANEIRIPVGRPVQVRLRAGDVIHSFWVPSLQGKMDLLPGRVTHTWIQADRPGVFRGQCAEYCGLQHTHMAFYVIAMPEEEFRAWYAEQRAPASPPADPLATEGARVFIERGCGVCHTIRGTAANGELGPDLTHIGGRVSIGAGMLPNTLGHMSGWIANPQQVKPGNFMPAVALSPLELRALSYYMQTLR